MLTTITLTRDTTSCLQFYSVYSTLMHCALSHDELSDSQLTALLLFSQKLTRNRTRRSPEGRTEGEVFNLQFCSPPSEGV